MRPTRRSKRDRSHMQIGLEARPWRCHAAPSATWICIIQEGASDPSSSPLAIPSLRAIRSSVLPTVAASVPPCVPAAAPFVPTPIVAVAAPAHAPAPAPTVPAPRIGTSPVPHALVPFHEEASLRPYPCAPLDHHDGIVELDFADTSALRNVDAFEHQQLNSRNGAKPSKRDKAREREEIEHLWDVPGKRITPGSGASHSCCPYTSPRYCQACCQH